MASPIVTKPVTLQDQGINTIWAAVSEQGYQGQDLLNAVAWVVREKGIKDLRKIPDGTKIDVPTKLSASAVAEEVKSPKYKDAIALVALDAELFQKRYSGAIDAPHVQGAFQSSASGVRVGSPQSTVDAIDERVQGAMARVIELVRAAKVDPNGSAMLKHVVFVHEYAGHVGVTYNIKGANFDQGQLAAYLREQLAKDFPDVDVNALALEAGLRMGGLPKTVADKALPDMTTVQTLIASGQLATDLSPRQKDLVDRIKLASIGESYGSQGVPCIWILYDGMGARFTAAEASAWLRGWLTKRGISSQVAAHPIFQRRLSVP